MSQHTFTTFTLPYGIAPHQLLDLLKTSNSCFLWQKRSHATAPLDYSVLGINPTESITVYPTQLVHMCPEGESICTENMMGYVEAELKKYALPQDECLPAFYGGYAGFFGYDMVQHDEPITFLAQDSPLPDACFYRFDQVLVFDHFKKTLRLFVHNTLGLPTFKASAQALYEQIFAAIKKSPSLKKEVANTDISPSQRVLTSLGKDKFCAGVKVLQQAIAKGDIFQAVLSERFSTTTARSAQHIYQHLTQVNPSPYQFFLKLPTFTLMGTSPEMLVKTDSEQLTTHPIAGTRPRGRCDLEDQRAEKELKNCPKERAEHLMLVDLARNDLGKVAAAGSVRVSRFQEIERFSHVMHLVSEVHGTPQKNTSPLQILRACFPAGTLSGAPKVRAMQYLAKLEPVRRKWYGGAVFCIGFDGRLDACITIRSLAYYPHKNPEKNKIEWQAGAGIVADSDPDLEYSEVCHKAKAMECVAS